MMFRKLSYLLLLLVVVLSVTGNIAKADLVDGLLVWHGFNNLIDGSGNGHDAVLGGNAFISDGLLWLDGDEDYADVGTPADFGPVNPLVDALRDFTIAIAYACESTGTFSTGLGSVLVSIGPDVASGTSDFALTTHNDGQAIWFWDVSGVPSRQSEVGYTDGTVHLTIVTYKTATDIFTFYHLDGMGGVVTHGDSTVTAWTPDWSAEWEETLNYGIRLGLSRNRTLAGSADVENTENLEGQIDMFAIWNRALDISEMPQIPNYIPAIELAGSLSPSDESILVERDAELSWSPGIYAATHNVYFGTDFNDVNQADTDSDLLVSPGQAGTSYAPPDLLDWGQSYYWRIDEVNAPANPGVHKGKTWSFTIEPYAYDMAFDEYITAVTASSFDPKYEPNNTINVSGLGANDLHDVNEFNMWLSAKDATEPAWIQYEFDQPYKLHELLVWNYNRFREDRLGYGFNEALIEYSTNGTDFTALDPVTLEAATGEEPVGPVTVALNGLVATDVRLTAVSNFMGRNQYGLSEVRFLYLPVRARESEPSDGAENVQPGTTLRWRAGRDAGTHDVLIGTVMDNLTLVGDDITETSFIPELVLSKTYYWQVLETDVAELAGDIWSFSTQDFLVVDDFESYNDIPSEQEGSNFVYEMWKDGFDNPSANGSTIGYVELYQPSMESDIVHSGNQSVPLMYDNSIAGLSEVTVNPAELPIGRDWSMANIKALTLYVHGSEDNLGGQLYVKLNDDKRNQSADLTGEYWQEVNIDLTSFNVDLQNVTSLTIGIAGAGSSGLVYIDDIRLYPSRCISEKVPGDLTGDCIVDSDDLAVIADNWLKRPLSVEYTFDSGFSDTSGNNRHGVGQNNPTVANDILTLNGTNFVDIPLGSDNPFDGSRDFSIAMDFKTDAPCILLSSARNDESANHSMSVYVHHWDEPYSGEVIYDNYSVGSSTVGDDPLDGEWHNMVVTYDAESELFIVYLDGVSGEAAEMNPAIPGITSDTVRIGGSLNVAYPYDEGVSDLVGEVDNIRIFNFTLTQVDVNRLPIVPTGPADLNSDGIVDQADQDIVEANMGPEKLWP